jgi:hypothetical protein
MVMDRNAHEGGPWKGVAMGSHEKGLASTCVGSEGSLGGGGGVT